MQISSPFGSDVLISMMILSVDGKTKITKNSLNSSAENFFLPTSESCMFYSLNFLRLSTIVNADQILVVHDGEIIERGR